MMEELRCEYCKHNFDNGGMFRRFLLSVLGVYGSYSQKCSECGRVSVFRRSDVFEGQMKKYVAWAESDKNPELWFLIDAPDLQTAKDLVMKEKEITIIRSCSEITPNKTPGISHKFTLKE